MRPHATLLAVALTACTTRTEAPQRVSAVETLPARFVESSIEEVVEPARVESNANAAAPSVADAGDTALDPGKLGVLGSLDSKEVGGVGGLMAALPQATCLVHPRGLRHLVDPSALIDGARAVYGDDELARHYGTPLPVPAARVQPSHDGLCIPFGGTTLRLIDTPGHARHHHGVWDGHTRTWFAGDTFGVSYRECDGPRGPWALPTTSPVQFEPDALVGSVQRLLDAGPERICVTHYGALGPGAALQRIGASLQDDVRRHAALGRSLRDAPDRHDRLRAGVRALLLDSARRQGVPLADDALAALLATDIELNALGLGAWLDRGPPR